MPDPKRAVLVTHQNCLDGACCEIVFIAAGGNHEDVYRVAAGEFDTFYENEWHGLQDRELIIADVYPTKEWIWDDLSTRLQPAVVIDHHRSCAKFLKEGRCLWFTTAMSASHLMRTVFGGSLMNLSTAQAARLSEFIDIIQRHDLWQNVDRQVEDIALLMRSIGYDEFVKRGAWSDLSPNERGLIKAERHRLSEKMEKIIANVEICGMNGVICALCVVSEDQSYVLNAVLDEFPEADVVFGVNVDDSCVSLRSRPGGADCSKIAESYGGGGHERAAGFIMKKSVTNLLLHEFVFKNQGSF